MNVRSNATVAASDPADAVGVDARVEQPDARVHRGLARADHREAVDGLGEVDEPLGGTSVTPGSTVNRGRDATGSTDSM